MPATHFVTERQHLHQDVVTHSVVLLQPSERRAQRSAVSLETAQGGQQRPVLREELIGRVVLLLTPSMQCHLLALAALRQQIDIDRRDVVAVHQRLLHLRQNGLRVHTGKEPDVQAARDRVIAEIGLAQHQDRLSEVLVLHSLDRVFGHAPNDPRERLLLPAVRDATVHGHHLQHAQRLRITQGKGSATTSSRLR